MTAVVSFFLFIITTLALSDACVTIGRLEPCLDNTVLCSPEGATGDTVPAVGIEISGLFYDLIGSISPHPVARDVQDGQIDRGRRRVVSTVCCAKDAECRLLQSLSVPFCWDPSTTNFFLPDGSSGNVYTGYYTSSNDAITNLITGDTSLPDGDSVNIYSKNPESKPVPSLLSVPTPRRSSRVSTKVDSDATDKPSGTQGYADFATQAPTVSESSAASAGDSTAGSTLSIPLTAYTRPPTPTFGYGSTTSSSRTRALIVETGAGSPIHNLRDQKMVAILAAVVAVVI